MQQQQRLAAAVPGAVQRLQRSVQHGGSAEQEAALQELVELTTQAEAPAAATLQRQMLQQPGLLPALKQLLWASDVQRSTAAPPAILQLLIALVHAGEQAAEQSTAYPGLLAALARLMQGGGSATARTFAAQAAAVLSVMCCSAAAARNIAAEPGILTGLVTLLDVKDLAAGITGPDGAPMTAGFVAANTLAVFADVGRAGAALSVLQQHVADLARHLQSDPLHPKKPLRALSVLNACIKALMHGDSCMLRGAVQQLAEEPDAVHNVLRLLINSVNLIPQINKRHELASATIGIAMQLLYFLVAYDSDARLVVSEVLSYDAAAPALVKVLDSKDAALRKLTGATLMEMAKGRLHSSAPLAQ
jgi:hypothetical protein